jgi:hypothetical protein
METVYKNLVPWGALALLICVGACGSSNNGDGGSHADASLGTDAQAHGDGGGGLDGTAGMDGSTASVKECQEQCAQDSDCMAMSMTQPFVYHCSGMRCVPHICTTDNDCDALFSGWTQLCTTGAECPGGAMFADCIDVGDPMHGRCGFPPTPQVTCAQRNQSDTMKQVFNMPGMMVTVCGASGYSCSNNTCAHHCGTSADCASYPTTKFCNNSVCTAGCMADGDCSAMGPYPSCNTASHQCVCTMNSCSSLPHAPVCQASGVCGCNADTQCMSMSTDACMSGFCGCSSATVCRGTKANPGTTWVCQ